MTMKTKYDGLLREIFYDEMHGTKEITYDTKYGHELRQKKTTFFNSHKSSRK